MLIADFLLYANFAPLPTVAPVIDAALASRKSILLAGPWQLLASNLLCPVVAVLYAAGAWHVFARFRGASRQWSAITGSLFALLATMSCVFHALWSQFALTVQHANRTGGTADSLFKAAHSHMQQTLDAATLVGAPLIIIMSVLVLSGRSSYPRWTAVFNPFLLYAIATPLLTPFANSLPTPYGALLLSSLSELTMAGFFLVSLMTLRGFRSPPAA